MEEGYREDNPLFLFSFFRVDDGVLRIMLFVLFYIK